MPETPDLDQIALRLVTQGTARSQVALVEQLRLVWNARGAADVVQLDAVLGHGSSLDLLDRAIRSLDVESRASVREP